VNNKVWEFGEKPPSRVITKRKLRYFWNHGWSLARIEERFGVQIYAGGSLREINANIWKGTVIILPVKGV